MSRRKISLLNLHASTVFFQSCDSTLRQFLCCQGYTSPGRIYVIRIIRNLSYVSRILSDEKTELFRQRRIIHIQLTLI